MSDRYLTIDEFLKEAEQCGCPISYRTLRFYSSLGLLPSATMIRDKSGRAKGHYPITALMKLELVFALQKRGLSLQQIDDIFSHILANSSGEEAHQQLMDWRERICQGGMLPLLYELSPLIGDTLREQLANMLRAHKLEPIASELRDIRLTTTTRTGQSFSRYFFIADERLEIANIFFWDLAGLAELLNAAAYQRDGWHTTSLPQVRTWLHGRSNWAPQDFLMAKYEGKPVGCIGLHRPWHLRLVDQAEIFGPVVHPEFYRLGIGAKLLSKITDYAAGLGIRQLLLPILDGDPASLDLSEGLMQQNLGRMTDEGAVYALRTSPLPSVSCRTAPLSGDPGKRYLHALLHPEFHQENAAAQAVADATMPGWVAITGDGTPAAIAWLNSLDRQVLLASNSEVEDDELAAVLAKALDSARLKGMQSVSCFISDRLHGEWLDKFSVQETHHLRTFSLTVDKPGR